MTPPALDQEAVRIVGCGELAAAPERGDLLALGLDLATGRCGLVVGTCEIDR